MKTIVNIVSQQTVPNYLFVKEKYQPGDKIIWIVSSVMGKFMDSLKRALLDIEAANQKEIILEKGREEELEYVKAQIEKHVEKDSSFVVNITGGTKLLVLAVYDFFNNLGENKVDFFYIPYSKNETINIKTQEIENIEYRVSVKEYFLLNDCRYEGSGEPYLSEECAKKMYSFFESGILYSDEINELRNGNYKGKKRYTKIDRYIDICEIENTTIRTFLIDNQFPTKQQDKINKYDVKYIVGEWLEDLMYYLTKSIEQPDDILEGIHVFKGNDTQSDQELDIVYTKDNVLYIRECKTGFEKESMFNEIVYKAAAIKTLFGLAMKSEIFCCREQLDKNEKTKEKMQETLNKMGVSYFGIKEIKKLLNETNKSI